MLLGTNYWILFFLFINRILSLVIVRLEIGQLLTNLILGEALKFYVILSTIKYGISGHYMSKLIVMRKVVLVILPKLLELLMLGWLGVNYDWDSKKHIAVSKLIETLRSWIVRIHLATSEIWELSCLSLLSDAVVEGFLFRTELFW